MLDTKELRAVLARHGTSVLNEDEVLELLDRLEAAERNLSCCCAEREEAASLFLSAKTRLTKERDALSAKIEAMEKQFPICRVKDLKRAHYMTKVVGLDPDAWLYALPGAKVEEPAPSIPEG